MLHKGDYMSKTDLDYEYLKVTQKNLNKPNFFTENENTKINGFDTETYKGDIYLLTYKFEDERSKAIYSNSLPQEYSKLSKEKIFDILTHYKCRNAVNVWYNLSFDVNVILKLLPKESLKELSILNKTMIKINDTVYTIKYIPNKFFRIEDQNNNSYEHYDVSQFFYASLNNAVNEWLNKSKDNDFIEDLIKYNDFEDKTEFFNNKENILNYFNQIKNYGKKDAELVQKLWKKFVKLSEKEKPVIPVGKPFSTGYIAEQTMRKYLDKKPYTPKKFQKMFWKSYKGGRFEVFQRGNVGDITIPDINSAYPSIMKNLPAPQTLEWKTIENPSIEDLVNADYGVLNATVTTNLDKKIQPFSFKKKNSNLRFPRLYKEEITTILPIFLYAYRNNFIDEFDLHKSHLAYKTKGTVYPFKFIEDLYNLRKKYEQEGKTKKAHLLKIVLNSMYGKTIQTTPVKYHLKNFKDKFDKYKLMYNKTELDLENIEPETGIAQILDEEQLLEGFEDFDIVKMIKTGNMFNPFLASYITGKTRLELMKQVYNYNLEDNLIMFATDSIMIDYEAFKQTNFEKDLVKNGLGNWDYDVELGEGFVIGSGVYEVKLKNSETGEYIRNNEGKIKCKIGARGFSKKKIKENGLSNLAQKYEDKSEIPIKKTRPRTFAEILWGKDNLKNVGNFLENEKVLNANMDNKRQWYNENINYKFLLNNKEFSDPIDHRRQFKENELKQYEKAKEDSKVIELNELSNIDKRQNIEAIGKELLGDRFDEHYIDNNLSKKEQIEELKNLKYDLMNQY